MTEETGDADDVNTILPDEMILQVFHLLPLESLLQCEQVCRHWRKLALDTTLWKRITIIYSGKPGQTEVSEKNLEILTSHCDYICNVKIQYVYNYPFIMSILEKCPNLTSIELIMCRVSTDFPDDLLRWPKLKKLSLRNSLLLQTKENTDTLIKFNHFKDLSYVALADFGLSSSNWNMLIQCVHLNHLYLEKIRDIEIDQVKELILAKKRSLVCLHVYGGTAIDDKCLQLLAHCPCLEELVIIRCDNLTDAGLLPLAGLTQIKNLQIWNNKHFTEMGLLSTLGSPNLIKLKSLSLSRVKNISPVIVDLISEHYKNLKFLAVYQCPRIIDTDYEKQLKSKFRNIDVVLY
ncbi:unnamed protein product [Plutella xylostella]|uniref:(diamondback moth) hypothetical protein n=1 Tax=Plutella xylostella TaxID=51655 RepID=A0A8S4EXT2_PLUXY|nr:unnamed protein product [Plutella xylostella]